MAILEQVKTLLKIEDDLQDNLLNVIIQITESHFKAHTKQLIIEPDLEFVIVEVAVKRFNRIGSEGLKSQSVEGLSLNFDTRDFDEYSTILNGRYRIASGFKLL